MRRVILGVVFTTALIAVGSAAGGPANANVTSYTASCPGFGTADSVRLERSLEASPTAGAGVAFHVVGSNQIVLFAGPPGLEARAGEEGTVCTISAINGEAVDPFPALVIFV
jgi:hypothetical protein